MFSINGGIVEITSPAGNNRSPIVRNNLGTPYMADQSGLYQGDAHSFSLVHGFSDWNIIEICSAIDSHNHLHLIHLRMLSIGSPSYYIYHSVFDLTDNANILLSSFEQLPDVVPPDGIASYPESLTMAIDLNDCVHIAFLDDFHPFTVHDNDSLYLYYNNNVGGSWKADPIQVIPDNLSPLASDDLVIAIDQDNLPFVSIFEYFQRSTYRGATSGFLCIGNGNNASSFTAYVPPNMLGGFILSTVDFSGNHYVTQNGFNSNNGLLKHTRGTSWSAWTFIPYPIAYPTQLAFLVADCNDVYVGLIVSNVLNLYLYNGAWILAFTYDGFINWSQSAAQWQTFVNPDSLGVNHALIPGRKELSISTTAKSGAITAQFLLLINNLSGYRMILEQN